METLATSSLKLNSVCPKGVHDQKVLMDILSKIFQIVTQMRFTAMKNNSYLPIRPTDALTSDQV